MKTTAGHNLLINTDHIALITSDPEETYSVIQLCNAIDHDDYLSVQATVDEIQAMIEGDAQAEQRQKFDHGPFNL
jgi:hypothetical protein